MNQKLCSIDGDQFQSKWYPFFDKFSAEISGSYSFFHGCCSLKSFRQTWGGEVLSCSMWRPGFCQLLPCCSPGAALPWRTSHKIVIWGVLQQNQTKWTFDHVNSKWLMWLEINKFGYWHIDYWQLYLLCRNLYKLHFHAKIN